MIIRVKAICSWCKFSLTLLSYILDVSVGVRSQRLLVLSQVFQSLIFNEEPSHTQPLLEQTTSIMEIVAVYTIPDVDMEGEVLAWSHPHSVICLHCL